MLNKHAIKEFLVIIGGTAIVAAAVFFFMLPSHVTVGSAAALAMVIGNYLPIPVSAITAGLNLFLLIIGFLLIGPEFGGKTVFTAMLMPAFMWVFECLFRIFSLSPRIRCWMLSAIFWWSVSAWRCCFPAMLPPVALTLWQRL